MKNTFILTLLAISLHAPSALADEKEKERGKKILKFKNPALPPHRARAKKKEKE